MLSLRDCEQVGVMAQFLTKAHKVSALLEQARAAGLPQTSLDAALDEDDSKTAVAALLARGGADIAAPSDPPPAKKRKTSTARSDGKEVERAEAEDEEEPQEEWKVDRDDTAVWKFVKDNREGWVEWLVSSRMASIGRDPARHDAATLRRFWNSEHPLPQNAFGKADESLLREIVSLAAMRDEFVEYLKIAPLKLSKTVRCEPISCSRSRTLVTTINERRKQIHAFISEYSLVDTNR
eukprot:COSAG02_NODE_1404_length_12808_cov_64.813282_9_plen_237_part_00